MLSVNLILRLTKGEPLGNDEIDGNFVNLKNAVESVARGVSPSTIRTADFTVAQGDAGQDVRVDSATAITANLATQASVPIQGPCDILVTQLGAGVVTLLEAGGVLVEPAGKRKTNGPGTSFGLRWISNDRWQIIGAK